MRVDDRGEPKHHPIDAHVASNCDSDAVHLSRGSLAGSVGGEATVGLKLAGTKNTEPLGALLISTWNGWRDASAGSTWAVNGCTPETPRSASLASLSAARRGAGHCAGAVQPARS